MGKNHQLGLAAATIILIIASVVAVATLTYVAITRISNLNTNEPITISTIIEQFKDDWRPILKASAYEPEPLEQYQFNLPVEKIPVEKNINANLNANQNLNQNTNLSQEKNKPKPTEEEEWYKKLKNGTLVFQTNWYCSAAGMNVFLEEPFAITNDLGIGRYHGDCTNPSVQVIGNFKPVILGEYKKKEKISLKLESDLYKNNKTVYTNAEGMCHIDYFPFSGRKDVPAIQFTCDDGFNIGLWDDIQFTIYVFPKNTVNIDEAIDLDEVDTDGDGLTDKEEKKLGTARVYKDTDKDGYLDKEEVDTGHDPLNPPVNINTNANININTNTNVNANANTNTNTNLNTNTAPELLVIPPDDEKETEIIYLSLKYIFSAKDNQDFEGEGFFTTLENNKDILIYSNFTDNPHDIESIRKRVKATTKGVGSFEINNVVDKTNLYVATKESLGAENRILSVEEYEKLADQTRALKQTKKVELVYYQDLKFSDSEMTLETSEVESIDDVSMTTGGSVNLITFNFNDDSSLNVWVSTNDETGVEKLNELSQEIQDKKNTDALIIVKSVSFQDIIYTVSGIRSGWIVPLINVEMTGGETKTEEDKDIKQT